MVGRLVIGPGSLIQLPECVQRLNGHHLMIVTDPGLVRAGICDRLTTLLKKAGISYVVYDKIEPDPRIEIVDDCLSAARDAKVDMMVGLGGGSSLDVAKVVAMMLVNGGQVASYVGIGKVPKPGVPTLMIPTTAGTGSEVTPIAVLSDKTEQLKKGIVSDYLIPGIALIDPELQVTLPPHVTAFTGIDALAHSLEAYTNRFSQPFIDNFALQGIRLVGQYLRRAVCCGDDMEARSGMAMAALYGGLCLGSVNTAAAHALAYPLGGTYDVPHGVAVSLLLPHVMEFNLVADLEKYALVADALGENTEGLSLRDAAELSVEALLQLSADIEIVSRLSDLDIPETAIDEMAADVMKVTRLLKNNPRVVTEEAAKRIYRSAY
jgi:alcohol dehydrogenase class IV